MGKKGHVLVVLAPPVEHPWNLTTVYISLVTSRGKRSQETVFLLDTLPPRLNQDLDSKEEQDT